MVTVLVGLVACGSDALRSVPTPPTVTFPTEVDEEIVLDRPRGPPARPVGLPAALAELRPGMDGTKARAVLDAAHDPGVKVFTDVIGTTTAVGTILAGTTTVGVTLLLEERGSKLAAVDVSLPGDVAVPMLTTRWGAPTETEFQDGGRPLFRWVVAGEPWTAELYGKSGEKAILKFTPEP